MTGVSISASIFLSYKRNLGNMSLCSRQDMFVCETLRRTCLIILQVNRLSRLIFQESQQAKHVWLERVWCNCCVHHTLGLGRDWHAVSLFITLQTNEHIALKFCCDTPSFQGLGPFVLEGSLALKIGSKFHHVLHSCTLF